jgi:predicted O-methyltransferase YrrM
MENAKKRGRKPKQKEVVETEIVERHSWNSEDECGAFMASLVKMNKIMTVLEIGVFEGETAQHLINALPQGGQYIGIDVVDYRTQKTIEAMNT